MSEVRHKEKITTHGHFLLSSVSVIVQSSRSWFTRLDPSSYLCWCHLGPVNRKRHVTWCSGRNWVRSSCGTVAVQPSASFFLFISPWNNCYFWLLPVGNYCQNILGQVCNLASVAAKVDFKRMGDRWKPNSLQQQRKPEKHLEPLGTTWPYLTQGNPASHSASQVNFAGAVTAWCSLLDAMPISH